MSRGIDYGHGLSNIDMSNGIRFGVISANVVGEAWYEDAEANFGKPKCPDCEGEVTEATPEQDKEWHCVKCKKSYDTEDVYPSDPYSYYYDKEGITAEQTFDDTDIFIVKSPYYTRAQFCSPCAPGAGHLENPCDDGMKTYCFGHDWFEGGEAPYPVYNVKDDSLVVSEERSKN